MTKYIVDLPDNVSFIVGKGYVLFNEKEFLRIPVKQLEKYSKKEDVEVEKDEEIVFDGRKEEQMRDKYVVSQEFMNDLNEWKEAYITDTLDEKYHYVSAGDLDTLPGMIKDWWIELNKPTETNNRLIAIIRWVNGEDVFEVEKPKKWVVRSKETDDDNDHWYVRLPNNIDGINDVVYYMSSATLFDTKEEAESWANAHQEVVEVKE